MLEAWSKVILFNVVECGAEGGSSREKAFFVKSTLKLASTFSCHPITTWTVENPSSVNRGLLLAWQPLVGSDASRFPLVETRKERRHSFSPWRNNADDTPMTPFTIYCQESLNQQKIPFEILFWPGSSFKNLFSQNRLQSSLKGISFYPLKTSFPAIFRLIKTSYSSTLEF